MTLHFHASSSSSPSGSSPAPPPTPHLQEVLQLLLLLLTSRKFSSSSEGGNEHRAACMSTHPRSAAPTEGHAVSCLHSWTNTSSRSSGTDWAWRERGREAGEQGRGVKHEPASHSSHGLSYRSQELRGQVERPRQRSIAHECEYVSEGTHRESTRLRLLHGGSRRSSSRGE